MNRTRTAGLLLLGALAALPVPPAAAEDLYPLGRVCEDSWVLTETGEFVATVAAGPLVVVDRDGPTAYTGTVTCSYTYNTRGHDDPTFASVTGPAHTLTVPPTVVTATLPPSEDFDYVAVCTKVELDGGPTLYWNAHNRGSSIGDWSTSSDSSCSGGPYALDCCYIPGSNEAEWLLGWPGFWPAVDGALCPVLAGQFPPEGDVGGLWDCPPYGS